MRWADRYKDMPEIGTKRIRKKFLIIPRLDEEGYWRSMESAYVEEVWNEGHYCIDICIAGDGWYKWRLNKVLPRDYVPVDEEKE